jgi:hypothetical protein
VLGLRCRKHISCFDSSGTVKKEKNKWELHVDQSDEMENDGREPDLINLSVSNGRVRPNKEDHGVHLPLKRQQGLEDFFSWGLHCLWQDHSEQ